MMKLWNAIFRCRDCNDNLVTKLLTQIQELKVIHDYEIGRLEREHAKCLEVVTAPAGVKEKTVNLSKKEINDRPS